MAINTFRGTYVAQNFKDHENFCRQRLKISGDEYHAMIKNFQEIWFADRKRKGLETAISSPSNANTYPKQKGNDNATDKD